MRSLRWQFGALCLAVFSLAGCASAPWVNQHIEAVNAEYRELEMYSYELEKENRQLCDEIESLQDENTKLRGGQVPKRRSGPFSSPNSSLKSTPPATPPANSGTRPRISLDPPAIDVPDVTIPETPAPALPPIPRATNPGLNNAAPRPFPGGASNTRPSTSVSSPNPSPSALPLLPSAPKPPRPILEDPPPEPNGELPPPVTRPDGIEPEPVDAKVTHLFLNPILTRGANFNGQPGDDGLAVVLEPRNQAGQFVPRAATVSIVVLDPTKSGDAARVARWTMDEKLIAQRINRSRDQRGIHLQLPWSGGVPETNQVKLFVRYETADGRKIEAQHDLILNPATQASQRWTPRSGLQPRTPVPAPPVVAGPSPDPATALQNANPPIPVPAVKSDLTQVIAEPPAPQTNVASKETEKEPNQSSEPSSPGLLTPPPARQPQRPEWKPFR